MEVRRTVIVTLEVDSDDAVLLHETVETFRQCANYVVDHAFKGDYVTTSKSALHNATYDDVRALTDGFNSGLIQAARNRAVEALKSTVEKWKKGKEAGKPRFTAPHIVYDKRTATFHDDRVTLATTNGRVTASYVLPDRDSETPHSEYLFSDDYQITGAELHYRNGSWELHIRTKTELEVDTAKQATLENGTVLGVDLGVNTLAVTSTGTYWTGDEFDHWRREYENRRSDLQRCGTRWAHENIGSVGRKEDGRFTQLLHRIANELVTEAREYECSIIAFEDLTGIRERTNASWGHVWAFDRLYEYIDYKAQEYGILVEQVDPANTSQRCSHCGFTHPSNREGESFECSECGYENHADYNAAKNIGLRYLRHNQTGGDGGAPLGVRLNSGTMKASGTYSPTDPAVGQSTSPR